MLQSLFTPDVLGIFHFFHCFAVLTFAVYLLTQFITDKYPAVIGKRRSFGLLIYVFFHGLFLLLRLHLFAGESFDYVEIYRCICKYIAHISLAGVAISLLGYRQLRPLIYCSTATLLTFGAYLISGHLMPVLLLFVVIPADILFACAMQHLALESKNKKEQQVFFRLGLLQILYLIVQLPLYLRYQPLVQNGPYIQGLTPVSCLVAILTFALLCINYFYLTHSRVLPEKRKQRFVLYGIVLFFVLVFIAANRIFSPGIHAYSEFNNQKLENVRAYLKDKFQSLALAIECLQTEEEKFFPVHADNISRRNELHDHLAETPFLLNDAGICTHSINRDWIGKNFTKDLLAQPLQKNKIQLIYKENNRTGSKGIFLVAPRIKDKKGAVCIKLSYPRFKYLLDLQDDCYLISKEGKVLADRTGQFSGMSFAGVTPDSLLLIDHNNKQIQLPVSFPEYSNKTYVYTTLKDWLFMDDAILILGVNRSRFFSLSRSALPRMIYVGFGMVLLLAFWQINKAIREKNNMIKLYHDNFCLSSGVPTIIFDENGIISEANCFAEDLFAVGDRGLNGKNFFSLIRSAETETIEDCVEKIFTQSTRELITGYACLPGKEKYCVFIFLTVPPHIAGNKKLYACRFMLRQDAVKVDPVPAGAWLSFCKYSKDPVFLLTTDGRIIASNFEERTGIAPRSLDDILTPENAHIFRSMADNVMLSGQVFNFEATIPTKGNVPRIYDILFFPVHTVTGNQHKPAAVGVVARNITSLRQSEKAVRDLQKSLKEQPPEDIVL